MISRGELVHHKIQAVMRDVDFPEDELKYIGVEDGEHIYLIGGEHLVKSSQLEDFELQEEDD